MKLGLGLGFGRWAVNGTVSELTTINVVLVAGQSNADGWCVPTTLAAGTPTWVATDGTHTHKVPSVKVWNGVEIQDEYDLTDISTLYDPTGLSPHNGRQYAAWDYTKNGGSADASKYLYGYADVALAQMAATIPNLVVCRVTAGGSCIALSENFGKGTWNAAYNPAVSGIEITVAYNPVIDNEYCVGEDEKALYLALKGRYEGLLSYCETNNITVNVLGLLWQQSAGDALLATAFPSGHAAVCPDADDDYYDNITALIAAIRGWTGCANLPWLCGTASNNISLDGLKNETIEDAPIQLAADDYNVLTHFNYEHTCTTDGVHDSIAACNTYGQWAALVLLCKYANPTYQLRTCGYYARVTQDGGTIKSLSSVNADIAAFSAIAVGELTAWDYLGFLINSRAGRTLEGANVAYMYNIVSRVKCTLKGTTDWNSGNLTYRNYRDPKYHDFRGGITANGTRRPTIDANDIITFGGNNAQTNAQYFSGRFGIMGLTRSLTSATIVAVVKIRKTASSTNTIAYIPKYTSPYSLRLGAYRSNLDNEYKDSAWGRAPDSGVSGGAKANSAALDGDGTNPDEWAVYAYVYDFTNKTCKIYRNGTEVAVTATTTSNWTSDSTDDATSRGWYIGVNAYWNGAASVYTQYHIGSMDMVEQMMFTTALDATDRAAVETYLMNKWSNIYNSKEE